MRLATFNAHNLFDRPLAFGPPGNEGPADVLDNYAKVSRLVAQETYDAKTKQGIADALIALDLLKSDESKYVVLRRNHGQFIKRSKPKLKPFETTLTVVAEGCDSWTGGIDLKTGLLPAACVRNTGQVIADIGADVQAVMEVESRTVLHDFAEEMIHPADKQPYEHAMEFDGNDDRGINVGLMTRHGWEITSMSSHVDDRDGQGDARDEGLIFSRDCAVYTVTSAAPGEQMVVLVNHLKSKMGTPAQSDAKRMRQAEQVAKIYRQLREEGHDKVAVVGDFNDDLASPALKPLLETDLRDICDYPQFNDGMKKDAPPAQSDGNTLELGTCGETAKDRFDYILLSPALFEGLKGAGIYRMGVWHTPHAHKQWDMYKDMYPTHGPGEESDGSQNAASDHALVYADINI